MEKFTDRTKFESCRRLLVLFFLICTLCKNIFAASPYENLKFKIAENQLLMTDNEISYSLIVPSAVSKNVSLKFSDFGKDVYCSSMEKKDFIDENGKKATLIDFSLSFSKKGVYELKPAVVTVNRRAYSVAFETLEIKENPYNLIPKLIIIISDSNGRTVKHLEFTNVEINLNNIVLHKNESYKFSVYVQNVSMVDNLVWEIPHNSIFSIMNNWESEAKDINRNCAKLGDNKKITPEILTQNFEKTYLLAEFQWTLLAVTANEFPQLKLAYHSFLEHKNVIEVKGISIKIDENNVKKNKGNSADQIESSFEAAFVNENESEQQDTELTYEDCLALAQQENKNLKLFNKFSRKNYGIIFKTELYSIPEEKASRLMQIKTGTKVEIKEQTGNWYYVISMSEESKTGWCKKENVILIK